MQTIKILFSIKVYFFFSLIQILISLLLLDFVYGSFGLNHIFLLVLLGTIILIIQIIFLLKYFNNPKKYSNIIIGFIVLYIIGHLISIKYSGFSIIIVLYDLFFLYKFIKFKKLLNKSVKIKNDKVISENKIIGKNKYIFYSMVSLIVIIPIEGIIYSKYFIWGIITTFIFLLSVIFILIYFFKNTKINPTIQYTDKNQYKYIMILYIISLLGLIIFYILYYSVPIVKFENINDSYFSIPKQYLNISEEENGNSNLKKYLNHLSNLEYKEDKNIYNSIFNKGSSIKNIHFDINKVNKIDNLRKGIEEIINKKSIVQKIDEDFFSLQGVPMMSKESIYNTLYHLEKGNETKALNYLIENYKFGNMLITGYGNIITFIVGITVQSITLEELIYILDNYNLDKNTLTYIKENIRFLPKINNGFKNTMIFDYHNFYYKATNLETSKVKYSSIFFASKEYLKKGLKNITYNNINNNFNYCRNTSDKIRESIISKLLLKKYPISTYYLMISCISLEGYSKDLEHIINEENKLLEKIDKLLEKKVGE